MIEFLSSWAKGLGVVIVIVSVLEMLLPNNKTKKYIRMVLGVYVIFNIIAPFIQNKDVFDINDLNLDEYQSIETSSVDQTSMNERIKVLYEQELEKDIIKKLEEKGYETSKCKVTAQISDDEKETKINKIKLNIEKKNDIEKTNKQDNETEEKIVTQIQKIKKVDTNIKIKDDEEKENEKQVKITKTDIQNVKKILIEEYGVNEKCLEIN